MNKKNSWSANGFGNNVSPDLVEDRFLEVEIVILLQGTNLFGDAIYSYLQLTGSNLKEMFRKMRSGENFKPTDFGTVLAAGRGAPSAEVKAEMAATYNMIDVPTPKPASLPARPAFSQPKFFGDE